MDTAPPEIYTLSLHDALPIYPASSKIVPVRNMWILRFINFVTKKRNDGFIQSEHGTQLYFPVLKILISLIHTGDARLCAQIHTFCNLSEVILPSQFKIFQAWLPVYLRIRKVISSSGSFPPDQVLISWVN